MDLRKYRALFLDEATDHLAEMSRALLALEKDPAAADPLEVVFRMAHSIKSMAASLDYESISTLSHRLEDRMESIRGAGRIEDPDDLALLFRGLETLERMVGHVRETGESPPDDEELCAELARRADGDTEKKSPRFV